jgi:hypothetical protein
LWLRPRLVIYNISFDELRPVLAELLPQLDPQSRWAGESLSLPALGIQLHVDDLKSMRNISLVSIAAEQNHAGWRYFQRQLATAITPLEVSRNPRGMSLVTVGLLILATLAWQIAQNPDAAFQTLFRGS